jgi:hypothetical protein
MKLYLFLHNNTQSHIAKKTQDHISYLNLDLLEHLPYSSDFAPCNYTIFPLLKKHLCGHIFESHDNQESEVRQVLIHKIPQWAYTDVMDALFSQWTKCSQLESSFIEKSLDLLQWWCWVTEFSKYNCVTLLLIPDLLWSITFEWINILAV